MVGNTPKHSRFLRTKVQYLQWEIPVSATSEGGLFYLWLKEMMQVPFSCSTAKSQLEVFLHVM